MLAGISPLHRQNLRPVFPVIIRQHHGNRRPNRLPMPHAAQNMRRLAFNPHPPPAPIPLLPPPQSAVNNLRPNPHPGTNPPPRPHPPAPLAPPPVPKSNP